MLKKYWRLLSFAVVIGTIGTTSYIAAQESASSVSDVASNENPTPYNNLLSENFRTTILSADSVKWLLIDPWAYGDSSNILLVESLGEILCSKTVIDSISINRISEVLTSYDSFRQDSLARESTFLPDFGAIFFTCNDTVTVSYSLYCDICRFQSDEDYVDLNGEYVREGFIENLRAVFPNDKFVRNLSRKK